MQEDFLIFQIQSTECPLFSGVMSKFKELVWEHFVGSHLSTSQMWPLHRHIPSHLILSAWSLQMHKPSIFSVSLLESLSSSSPSPQSTTFFIYTEILSVNHEGDFDILVLARSRLIFLCILFFPQAINTENSNNRMWKKKKKISGEILNSISKSASYHELGIFFFFLNCLKQLGN